MEKMTAFTFTVVDAWIGDWILDGWWMEFLTIFQISSSGTTLSIVRRMLYALHYIATFHYRIMHSLQNQDYGIAVFIIFYASL
jgi:hypothetical protein